MERQQLDDLLAQIRKVRMQTLSELNALTQDDFATPTDMPLWTSLRRLLLRFGDHMREHANQIEDARIKLGRGVSMPQRMLAESEVAWGKLLAATAGLSDADLDAQPDADEWSVRQVLDHILAIEKRYLNGARTALASTQGTHYGLGDEEITFYHANGYLGPFTAVDEEEMATIRAHIDNDVLQRDGPNPRTRVQSRHMDSAVVYDLATHPAIVDRMASIMGPDLIMWATNFFVKEHGGSEIPWHQDINFWPLEPPINISAWVAVDNVTVENSCVRLIPGSHKRSIPHIPAGEGMAFGEMADPAYFDADEAINMELRPGQFFLFTERLLHHSYANRSRLRRMGMSIRVTLPIVTIDQDNPPLHPDHTAVLAHGRDTMGFNRLGERPERP